MVWGFRPRASAADPPLETSPEPDESLPQHPSSTLRDTPAQTMPEASPGPSDQQISAITNLLALQLDASRRHDDKIGKVQLAIAAIKSEFNAAVQAIRADHENAVQLIKADHASAVRVIKADHEIAVQAIKANQETAVRVIKADHDTAVKTMRADHEALAAELKKQIASLLTTVETLARQQKTGHAEAPNRSLETPDASDHIDDPTDVGPLAVQEDFDISQYVHDVSPDVDITASGASGSDDVQIVSSTRHIYWKDGKTAQTGTKTNTVISSARPTSTSLKSIGVGNALAGNTAKKAINADRDNAAAGPSTSSAPATPDRDAQNLAGNEDIVPATGSGRSRRTSSKRKDYHSHPLDGIINRKGLTPKRPRRTSSIRDRGESSPLKDHGRAVKVRSDEEDTETAKRAEAKGKAKGKVQMGAKAKGARRTFNGRVTMNDQTLKASDGDKRGNGTWPAKGENTVKGNVQEIECDVCCGRVHWACAGFEDDTIAPDEWQCPDCELKLKHGLSQDEITPGPRDRCLRWTCIKKDHKKIQVKEGDQDQYVVERFIGRRAIARNPDDTRVFEYLVSWYGWHIETATWEPGKKWPAANPFIDEFLRECHQHQIKTKPRVVLLPEALKYFDPITGKNLNEEDSEEEEEEEEVEVNETGPVPSPQQANGINEEEKMDEYVDSE